MSPQCLSCGSHVSRELLRVAAPETVTDPPVCPSCPDMRQHGYTEILLEVMNGE